MVDSKSGKQNWDSEFRSIIGEKHRFRIDTLKSALRHPKGIDAIMEQKSTEGNLREFLQSCADRVDELSEIELYALTVVIGITRN